MERLISHLVTRLDLVLIQHVQSESGQITKDIATDKKSSLVSDMKLHPTHKIADIMWEYQLISAYWKMPKFTISSVICDIYEMY